MVDLTKYKNIHCIGIGGIGVSALAEIMVSRGYQVSGSDMKESAITDHLASMGVKIHIGHRAENVENADLIVYSAAIAETNPEVVRAKELGIPMIPRAELLGTLMNEHKNSIAVSGTHGKTTTTSMISLIIRNAAMDPTIVVGGELAEIGGNVRVGHGDYFVAEACEYRDSFLQLRPRIEIILNIDSDHLDYFKDVDHIEASFEKFAGFVPNDGMIIAYDSNPFVEEATKGKNNVIRYGYNSSSDYHIVNVKFHDGYPSFDVEHKGEKLGHVELSVPGEHNILNVTAAFACCHELGIDTQVIVDTLKNFTGIQRRFNVRGMFGNGVRLVDDYAHHPTEIKATLTGAEKFPHEKLWVVFQPHTYTRTLALFDGFADALEEADVIILADIYAAREKDIYNISSEKLAKTIHEQKPNKEVLYMPDFHEIADFVRKNAQKGDMVITMGAGDIYKVGDYILEAENK